MRPPSRSILLPGGGAYLDELVEVGLAAGLHHVGVAPATVLERARTALLERKAAGLHDSMEFTYRNPQRSTDPDQAVHGAKSVVVAARSYAMEAPPRPLGAARIARYAWVDHYEDLRQGLRAIRQRLRADGHKAVMFADDNSVVDREMAWAAGLGWYGKNANLLMPGVGSYVVLGCVITTAELPPSAAPVADGCGSCHRCIDACPTGAIVAPGVVDAGRCLAWLLQKPGPIDRRFRAAIGDRLYGCDDCQEVCPPTIHFERRHRLSGAAEQAWVPVVALLDADDDTLLATYGRWYLANRDPQWWRRNALVVLGNTADPADPEVRRVLGGYVADARPVLRGHAIWAAARLGLHHLIPASDHDPMVAEEIALAAGDAAATPGAGGTGLTG